MPAHLTLWKVVIVAAMLAASTVCAQESKYDEAPVPTKTVAPTYPHELKQEGVAGMVTVAITVDEAGLVQNPVVRKSSRVEFEKPALEAISRWKFVPAKKDGKPIALQVVIPIKFTP